jgi:hypothetical protein
MRRWVLILLLLVAVAVGGWVWGSPYLVVRAMEKAAEARDAETLSEYVDYPAVRRSMKGQLRQRFESEADAGEEAALGALVATGIADSIVDAAITPEGIRAIFAAGAVDGARDRRPAELDARKMELRRDSLDRFRLVRSGGQGGALIFALRGVEWKLVGIELPPERD